MDDLEPCDKIVELDIGPFNLIAVEVQFRGLNLPTNQVTASDKVKPSAVFKSANVEIT